MDIDCDHGNRYRLGNLEEPMSVADRLPVSPALKRRILMAIPAGALAIASVLVANYEPGPDRGKPYRDVGGVWTVCDGHTGPDVIPTKHYSDAECDALRKADLAKAQKVVHALVKVPMTAPQEAALIDFAYNKGAGNLARSSLLRETNAGNQKAACLEYRKWVYGGGKELPGLVLRAQADQWVCSLSPTPEKGNSHD